MIKLLESQNTAEVADRFAAEKFQLTLTERDSTCTITVGPTAPEINVGAWLQDEDEPGAGIVWRVRSVQTDYKTQTRTIQCEHAIMALKDFLLFGEVTPAVITGLESAETCTADETFRYILSHQSIWRFGSVLYNDTQAYNFNGDDLYTAMETITATIPNAWWSYDFSRVPYVISVVEKPESYIGQLSELRMDRNMKSLSVTVDRSRMYTRFYPIGRNNLMLPELYVGRNESLYGVSSQTETDENRTTEADLRKWANERLDNHAEPQVTVSVNAMDLSAITGEDLDNFVLGAHCTVALPEYNTTIYERITTLQWPDKVRDPMGVTITMANQKQDLTKILSKEKKKTSTGRRSSAVSVSKSLKDVTLSGPTNNIYTLTKVLTNGKTEQIGTFSRAVTSWVVDVPTGGTIRVTAKPQDQSKSIQIGQGAGSWDGNTYSGLITYSDDDAAHWFSSGKYFTVDATARYNAGWDNAAGMSSPAPAWSGSGEHTSFSYSYPLKETIDNVVTRHKVTDTLKMGKGTPSFSGYATVKRGDALIARINIGNWYSAGWDNASSLSEAAEAKTSSTATNTFTYKYPVTETIEGVLTRHQVTDTLTVNNTATPAASGYVTVSRGAALIARVNVGNWWTAGWDNASSLSEAAEAKTGSQATNEFTYKYPVTETIEGVLTRHQVTDTLTVNNNATPAASGFVTVSRGQALIARVNVGNWWTAGWDNASSLSEAAEAKTGAQATNEFTYKYPVTETIEGVLTRHQVTDTLTVNNNATPAASGFVTVSRGAALIARVNVGNWWTAGWDNASSLSEAAEAKTGSTVTDSFTYKYPVTETIEGVLTRHQVTDTLTVNNNATPASSGFVTVSRGAALIARVNVGNWWTAGWDNASSLSEAAAAKTSSTVSETFTYKFPVTETIDGVLTRHQVTDTLTMGKSTTHGATGYATVTRGAALIARISIGDWYTSGWDAASSLSEAAEAKTSSTVSDTFTFKYPVTETIGGVVTRHQVTDTLTIGKSSTHGATGYASVIRGQALIARVSIGDWYTSGWDAASALSEAAPVQTSETVSETFSYKYPVTETIGGVVTRHQVTDTLTMGKSTTPAASGYAVVARGAALIARIQIGDWYTAGYEAGLPSGIDVSSPPINVGVNEPSNSTKLDGFGQAYIKSHYSGYGWLQFTVTVHGKQKKYHFAFDNR